MMSNNPIDSTKAAELLLDSLIEAFDAIVWEADWETLRYRSASRRLARTLGVSHEDVVSRGLRWEDHIHPADVKHVLSSCRSWADHGPFQIEYRMITSAKRMVWVRDIVTVLFRGGEPSHLRGVRVDISDARQSEILHEFAQIVASSLDYREIVNRSLVQLSKVWIFDSASIYLRFGDERKEFLAAIGFEDVEMTKRQAEKLLESSPILRQMIADQKPVISPDVSKLKGWIWIPGAMHVRSFMGVPLVVRSQVVGALMLDSSHTDFFKQSDLKMVETLAQHVSSSIENAWLFEATEKQLAQRTALLEATTSISQSLELEVVLSHLAEQMGRALDATSSYISDWDEAAKTSRVVADYYSPEASELERVSDLGRVYNLQDDFEDDVDWIAKGQVEIVHIDSEHLPALERQHMLKYGAQSVLCIPIASKDNVLGYAELWDSRRKREFSSDEISLCSAIAQQAAIAMDNARLFQESRLRAKELEVLHAVAIATIAVVDVDRLLSQTTEMIAGSIYPSMFGFILVNDDGKTMTPHPSYHGVPELDKSLRIPIDASVAGLVVTTGTPFISGDVSKVERYYEGVSSTKSEIAVPLLIGGVAVGTINAESDQYDAFGDKDLRLLVTLASQVAGAIDRAKLYEALQRQADALAHEVQARTAELKAERDRTLTILESAGESIILTDAEANILYVNPATEVLTGYSRQELLSRSPRLFGSTQGGPASSGYVWPAMSDGSSWSGELVSQKKDGTRYDVAVNVTPINDAEGSLTGYVAVQSDISRLKEVDRLKSQFVSNVSHELRTPLTNIKMYLSLLERGREEKRSKYLRVMSFETERLERLIIDLLDLSQLDDTVATAPASVVSPNEVLKEQLNAFSAKAEAKNIHLKLNCPRNLPGVSIERSHLGQLLTNLLGNALTYSTDHGEVILAAGTDKIGDHPMLWIQVKDTGPGIAHNEKPQLFHRFFRGSAARNTGAPGTGLGLAICKEIVDRYGGNIDVESEPGEGATFTVWLPVESHLS